MALLSSLCSSPFPNSTTNCNAFTNLRTQIQSSSVSTNICYQKIDTSLLTISESFYDDELWAAASLRVRSFNQLRPDTFRLQDHARYLAEREFEALKERVAGKRTGFKRVSCINATLPLSHISTISDDLCSACKVHMQGMAVGRAVDLTRFDGYEDLLRKLEEMFDIKGELCGSAKKWQVVYTDNEDDMMMVGDDPWLEFCSVVRKIFIYTAEEVKKLSPKIGLPMNDEGKPSKLDSEAIVNPEDQSSVVGPGC